MEEVITMSNKQKNPKASPILVILVILETLIVVGFAIYYSTQAISYFPLYVLAVFAGAFVLELLIQHFHQHTIKKQIL